MVDIRMPLIGSSGVMSNRHYYRVISGSTLRRWKAATTTAAVRQWLRSLSSPSRSGYSLGYSSLGTPYLHFSRQSSMIRPV